ncbi:hypothetical protein AVEN_17339-1 [Araneus ventricosus]|uniref:Uncharacterized protein n=1 Tax=Araneus ventricosus TaxID=182803 RepID=A0A4Y2Q3V6_ARAVE|nr:hypothetical protein AVEN_17339-1 [Araneus ventricosus]
MKDASQVKDRSLEKLMNFFKQEVKGEEMVELARTGFLSPANQKKNETVNKLDNYRTAATLEFDSGLLELVDSSSKNYPAKHLTVMRPEPGHQRMALLMWKRNSVLLVGLVTKDSQLSQHAEDLSCFLEYQ